MQHGQDQWHKGPKQSKCSRQLSQCAKQTKTTIGVVKVRLKVDYFQRARTIKFFAVDNALIGKIGTEVELIEKGFELKVLTKA